jgi:hypothetical protein
MRDDPHEAQVKAARNQSLFREVNERVEHLQQGWAPVSEIDFVCECADDSCTAPVSMTIAQYEQIRARPVRFFVLPEHIYPEVEVVVSRTQCYWTVEKVEDAAQVAAALDPRQGTSAA